MRKFAVGLASVLVLIGCGDGAPAGRGTGGSGGGKAGSGGNASGGSTGHGGSGGQPTGGGGQAGGSAGSGDNASFVVGGTVTGLVGSGLILQDGAGHHLSISAAGAFTFADKLPAGTAVAVTVSHQPSAPAQTCAVTSGSASSLATDLTSVAVTCTTNSYAVGGTVTGLTGAGLVLQDNLGDDLPVTADGAFTFATPVASGATYTVTVKTQPAGPAQSCQVTGGSGTIGSDDVTSISVNCAISTYTVGGTITGLAGTGLILQNNGADDLSVSSNGSFAFATPVASGQPFAVTVKAQPAAPAQVCSISQGSGTVASGNVSSVAVVCSTNTYPVAGTVSGLAGMGLVLQNNLGDNLSIAADGTFSFAAKVADAAPYSVTVLAQPSSPSQTCTVSGGSGTISGAGVSNVAVQCVTRAFAVGGTVVGLSGAGLALHNGSDVLAISQDGSFTFPTPVLSGAAFDVSISAQPTGPSQTCMVTGGSGTVGGAPVTSVTVNCATDRFTISGTVTGLAGDGLTLALNDTAPTLPVGSNGMFSFPSTLPDGSAYTVSVQSQPTGPSQTCTVTNGSSTLAAASVSNVTVACTTNSYLVGGSVTGLAGMGLTLQNQGADDLTIMADGSFVFPTSVPSGQGYAVTVSAQPTNPWQTCTVSAGSGGVTAADIGNVAITCTTNSYRLGGTVSGLAGPVTLHNGTDTLVVGANGPFAFDTPLVSGAAYAVTVTGQPISPSQTCTVDQAAGKVAGADVASVAVSCVTNRYPVGGMVSGLLGSGLTLRNNGGDDLTVGSDGTFTFSTSVLSGASYAVTIQTQPLGPSQTCTVSGDTGTVGASPVTSVNVNCSTNAFTVGGTVTGLTGDGLVLQNNGGNDLALSGSGTFAFPGTLLSGATYNVTVKTAPTHPWESCAITGGSGTVGSANASVAIHCSPIQYGVSVNVSGLAGSGLVLQDNAGDNLPITSNGTFGFAASVPSGQTYAVTVLSQPTNPWQTCTVTSPSGTIAGSAVTLAVNCVNNSYSVGGTVSGLSGSGLVLQDNAGDDLPISASGTFTFLTNVASGSPYAVTVLTPPSSPAQNCVVSNGSGTVGGASVSNVSIVCSNVLVCGTADENSGVNIVCRPGQTISAIDFASYGTPNGSCGNFTTGSCDASNSLLVVTATCVGANSCTIPATNGVFGDPCVGTFKRLYIQARCQ